MAHIPDQLVHQLDLALIDVGLNPNHHLLSIRRREIYDSFGSRAISLVNLARGTLAILTAQRVLPMWFEIFPRNTLPQKFIDAAISIQQNQINYSERERILEEAYQAAGNSWGYIDTDIPAKAESAAYAAYYALLEVCGREPFLSLYKVNDTDTAYFAAMATSYDPIAEKTDSMLLAQFWEWWLTEAIPQAWAMVEE